MTADVECGACYGEGIIMVADPVRSDDISPPCHEEPCPACEGTGVRAVDIMREAGFDDD